MGIFPSSRTFENRYWSLEITWKQLYKGEIRVLSCKGEVPVAFFSILVLVGALVSVSSSLACNLCRRETSVEILHKSVVQVKYEATNALQSKWREKAGVREKQERYFFTFHGVFSGVMCWVVGVTYTVYVLTSRRNDKTGY